jgi:Holliday junction resolvase RusA-like endonuclease
MRCVSRGRAQFGDRRAWTARARGKSAAPEAKQRHTQRPTRHATDCRCESAQACARFDAAIAPVQVIEIIPVPKPRMSQRDRFRKRPAVLRYRAYADALRAAGVQLPHACICVCYLPMPTSWSVQHRRQRNGTAHRVRPDASNLLKAIEDACCANDARLDDSRSIKRWATRGRVLVLDAQRVHDIRATIAAHLPAA